MTSSHPAGRESPEGSNGAAVPGVVARSTRLMALRGWRPGSEKTSVPSGLNGALALLTPSLRKIALQCVLTVLSDTYRAAAIPLRKLSAGSAARRALVRSAAPGRAPVSVDGDAR